MLPDRFKQMTDSDYAWSILKRAEREAPQLFATADARQHAAKLSSLLWRFHTAGILTREFPAPQSFDHHTLAKFMRGLWGHFRTDLHDAVPGAEESSIQAFQAIRPLRSALGHVARWQIGQDPYCPGPGFMAPKQKEAAA